MKQNYLLIDTETSGLSASKNAITQIAALIFNEQYEKLFDFDFYIAPYDRVYEEKALLYSKITHSTLTRQGIPHTEAVDALKLILNKFNQTLKSSIIVVGHNVSFDIAFLSDLFLTVNKKEPFYKYVNSTNEIINSIDTLILSKLLMNDYDNSFSLGSLANHYSIVSNDLHNAKNDVNTTFELLKKLIFRNSKQKEKEKSSNKLFFQF